MVHSAGAADAAKPSGDKAKAAKTEKSAAAKAKDAQPKKDAAAAKKDQPAKKQAVKEKKKETAKTARLVRMTIKGDYPEGPTSAGMFGDLKPSLRTIIDRIDQAAEDTDVDAVVLRSKTWQSARARSTSCAGPSPGSASTASRSMPS